jgi:hypothetical protein
LLVLRPLQAPQPTLLCTVSSIALFVIVSCDSDNLRICLCRSPKQVAKDMEGTIAFGELFSMKDDVARRLKHTFQLAI